MSGSSGGLKTSLLRAVTFLALISLALTPTEQVASSHRALSGRNAQRPPSSRIIAAATTIGKIAFTSDRDGNTEIYTMDADGGQQVRLTENPAEDFSPAWSPDGRRIAFVSTRDGNAEIYVMNSDGTEQTRLTNNNSTDLNPAWNPNGLGIGFIASRDGNDEVYMMTDNGSGQFNLTNDPAEDSSFSFSPDGTMIAFASNRETSQFDIYRTHAGAIGVSRLTTAEGDDINPRWTQQQISFQSNRDENEEVYSMAPDGTNQIRRTSNTGLDVDPSQSADGRIVFSSDRDGNLEIYALGPGNTAPFRLTTNDASDVQPAVQPGAAIPPPPDENTPTVQFANLGFSISEGASFGTLTVTRSGSTTAAATVDFSTVNGTATNKSDYIANFGTLKFNAGETAKTFRVLITDDAYIEADETLTVTLSNPTGAALGSFNTSVLTILDNDTALPTTNPINDARFFVNQQYFDFLNRAPEQGGLDYWTDQITRCGSNPTCLLSRRNAVSAAFFIEAEFQLTGFFVYRLHQASFGVLPLRQRFIMDRARVAVGPTLEADKLTLANDFVMRDAFLMRYPASFTPEQFVNKLFDTAGLIPFTAERQRFINDMHNGKTRAQVLIEVIEIPEYKTREFNPAFVIMQYFGYLGRDPEPGGFAFWLDVLNNRQPNNYPGLVCAFITSEEYQLRFSPVITANNSQCIGLQ
jgi:Calx-beta domain/WD40-like Beta Propeller Repeat